jgi:hypothetical protein
MRCYWLRVVHSTDSGGRRLVNLGQHEQLPHMAETKAPRAAARLLLGQTVHFPVDDPTGLATVKDALQWAGVKVRACER